MLSQREGDATLVKHGAAFQNASDIRPVSVRPPERFPCWSWSQGPLAGSQSRREHTISLQLATHSKRVLFLFDRWAPALELTAHGVAGRRYAQPSMVTVCATRIEGLSPKPRMFKCIGASSAKGHSMPAFSGDPANLVAWSRGALVGVFIHLSPYVFWACLLIFNTVIETAARAPHSTTNLESVRGVQVSSSHVHLLIRPESTRHVCSLCNHVRIRVATTVSSFSATSCSCWTSTDRAICLWSGVLHCGSGHVFFFFRTCACFASGAARARGLRAPLSVPTLLSSSPASTCPDICQPIRPMVPAPHVSSFGPSENVWEEIYTSPLVASNTQTLDAFQGGPRGGSLQGRPLPNRPTRLCHVHVLHYLLEEQRLTNCIWAIWDRWHPTCRCGSPVRRFAPTHWCFRSAACAQQFRVL